MYIMGEFPNAARIEGCLPYSLTFEIVKDAFPVLTSTRCSDWLSAVWTIVPSVLCYTALTEQLPTAAMLLWLPNY